MEKSKLHTVQLDVQNVRALIGLSEPGGMDIAAAGKQQFIKGSGLAGQRLVSRRHGRGKALFIIFGLTGNTGDQDVHIITCRSVAE